MRGLRQIREAFPDGLTQEQKDNFCVGKFKINAVKCNSCQQVIESDHKHDLVACECGSIFVDGGSWYLRRGGDLDGYTELSEKW